MHAHCARLIGALLLGILTVTPLLARELPFEDRIKAQKAIEQIYYHHQIGAARPFETAVPDRVVEEKVRNYLRQSAALERRWSAPVTREALHRELERIAGGTHYPNRLAEIYRALDNDSFLMQECFVRPVLVDRLARSFFAFDQAIHQSSRARAEQLRQQVRSGALLFGEKHPLRTLVEVGSPEMASLQAGSVSALRRPVARGAVPAEHSVRADSSYLERHAVPEIPGIAGPLLEQRDSFTFSILIDVGETSRVATYRVPKISWDEWWSRSRSGFEGHLVRAVASGEDPLLQSGSRLATSDALRSPSSIEPATWQESSPPPGVADDTWDNGIMDNVPDGRRGHTAIWTGTEMIIWGGLQGTGSANSSTILNSGSRYDPLTDTWIDLSIQNAPSPRWEHAAVWTGTVMIVWGGRDGGTGSNLLNSGGRYDSVTDTWSPVSVLNAPIGRFNSTATWTGSEMIIWGGSDWTSTPATPLQTGARYDPAADSWTPTSILNAPDARAAHSAVWTGNEMIVWGGATNTGGRYNPATDSWLPTALGGAPSSRAQHSALWTGNRMLIWGGGWPLTNTGGLYDPSTNTWSPISAVNAPSVRLFQSALWTGDSLLVWGGVSSDSSTPLGNGARYDPASDTWTAMTASNAPSPRTGHTAIWAGDRMIAWGGWDYTWRHYGTGGRYDPLTDVWTPTSTGNAAAERADHTAIWTGNLMVVWGGRATDPALYDTGARYDPVTDAWSPTTVAGAPIARSEHAAVWTGNRMVIWGGSDSSTPLASGGQYDPIADTWTTVTTANAPPARLHHTAVWSGDEMIVWGGTIGYDIFWNTGGRYDPVADAWTATTTTASPSARANHSAVWTGSEMIVWGGRDASARLDTGAKYDPALDSWSPIPSQNAPSARTGHSGVWTGDEMIVWGGTDWSLKPLAGGRYDPAADVWNSTATSNAPEGRLSHTAIWTGTLLIVWGGLGDSPLANGGRYDPFQDSWTPTSVAHTPLARYEHTVIWTGDSMLIWGGWGPGSTLNSGGRYFVMDDPDGDGVTASIDNCPFVSNVDQQDSDADGRGDVCDCAPGDPSAYADPTADITLQWDSATLLEWNSLAAPAGPGILYDLCQGTMGPGVMQSGGPEICYASGSSQTNIVISATPASGKVLYHFARGTNACQAASFGQGTDGTERPTATCD